MNWLAANWLWVVFGLAFVALHLFGHGGHGGNGGDRDRKVSQSDDDDIEPRSPPDDRNARHHH